MRSSSFGHKWKENKATANYGDGGHNCNLVSIFTDRLVKYSIRWVLINDSDLPSTFGSILIQCFSKWLLGSTYLGQVTLSSDSLKHNKVDWFKLKPKSDEAVCGEIHLRIDVGSPEPVLDTNASPQSTFKKAVLDDNSILIDFGHYYVKYGNLNDKTPKKYFNIQTKSRVHHII